MNFNTTGKKAFIFSLDMFIAVVITILVMSAAHRHMINAEANRISDVQMVAAGSDIAALLDSKGILQTLDKDSIESGMNELLPQNYKMFMKIAVDDGTIFYVGDSLPENQFAATGKRFFAVKSGRSIRDYAYVTYWVWSILSLEEELKRTLRRSNLVLIVVAIELLPIALVATYFLVILLLGEM